MLVTANYTSKIGLRTLNSADFPGDVAGFDLPCCWPGRDPLDFGPGSDRDGRPRAGLGAARTRRCRRAAGPAPSPGPDRPRQAARGGALRARGATAAAAALPPLPRHFTYSPDELPPQGQGLLPGALRRPHGRSRRLGRTRGRGREGRGGAGPALPRPSRPYGAPCWPRRAAGAALPAPPPSPPPERRCRLRSGPGGGSGTGTGYRCGEKGRAGPRSRRWARTRASHACLAPAVTLE